MIHIYNYKISINDKSENVGQSDLDSACMEPVSRCIALIDIQTRKRTPDINVIHSNTSAKLKLTTETYKMQSFKISVAHL